MLFIDHNVTMNHHWDSFHYSLIVIFIDFGEVAQSQDRELFSQNTILINEINVFE